MQMTLTPITKFCVFLAVVVLIDNSFANKLLQLEKQKYGFDYSPDRVLFHTIVYDDSNAIYLKDLKSLISKQLFSTNASDSIKWDSGPVVVKFNMQGFLLLLTTHLCQNDTECKEILWKKKNDHVISMQMLRALVMLMPEKIPSLLREFKQYPTNALWRTYCLNAVQIYSLHPALDAAIVDSIQQIVRENQKEWMKIQAFNNDAAEYYLENLSATYEFQKSRNLSERFIKRHPTEIQSFLENIITDKSWDKSCEDVNNLIKRGDINVNGANQAGMWLFLIKDKCGTITHTEKQLLKQQLLSPMYPSLLSLNGLKTPMLNKLLHDYANALLLERKKKNPHNYLIWPKIVGPLK